MSDMEDATEQFARDLAIASGDLPDTPAGPAPGVPTWRLDYLPVVQALTQAGYGRVDVAPTPDEPTQPVPDELVEAVNRLVGSVIVAHGYIPTCKQGERDHVFMADALAPPIRTEADIRDDERERLAKLALSDASDLCKERYLQDDRAKTLRYLADWLRSQTQVEE